eukprot:g655.t1
MAQTTPKKRVKQMMQKSAAMPEPLLTAINLAEEGGEESAAKAAEFAGLDFSDNKGGLITLELFNVYAEYVVATFSVSLECDKLSTWKATNLFTGVRTAHRLTGTGHSWTQTDGTTERRWYGAYKLHRATSGESLGNSIPLFAPPNVAAQVKRHLVNNADKLGLDMKNVDIVTHEDKTQLPFLAINTPAYLAKLLQDKKADVEALEKHANHLFVFDGQKLSQVYAQGMSMRRAMMRKHITSDPAAGSS